MFDENTDGFIDFQEYITVSYILKHGTKEDRLKLIFNIFDIDKDGQIDKQEMFATIKSLSMEFTKFNQKSSKPINANKKNQCH